VPSASSVAAEPLWTPTEARVAGSQLTAFARHLTQAWGTELADYDEVHGWSARHPEQFWTSVWDFAGIVGERGARGIEPGDEWWRARFFPDAQLNFAENLLRRGDDAPALISAGEHGTGTVVSWAELRSLVARIQQALLVAGVEPGDRVAAWVPNVPECIALMLASAGLGAVFSSCSPDFGTTAVIDRFGQIEPSVLVAVDRYHYDGETHDCIARLRDIQELLPSVRCTVVIGDASEADWRGGDIDGAVAWDEWLAPHDARDPEFRPLPFDHPLYALYSSGTTGAPKCIVHRAGGILLKHAAEHRLQCDVRAGDRVIYFTTTGWMMWNWLASALACGATLVLYDGSPLARDGHVLWDLAVEHAVTLFGTSAKFLDECRRRALRPATTHDLGALRTIASTGSPLSPESFAYTYAEVKADVHLASISGGTDLCGCLVAGDPTSPVWPGEIQRPALGLDVAVLEVDGSPLGPGSRGELVCRNAFPSIPLGFWSDPGERGFRAAYFDAFPGAWHQGDFAEWTVHGGIVIHGRSDATLNPGGVRIGSAEIYRAAESVEGVAESLAIGQAWDGDTRIVLFVVLEDGVELTEELTAEVRGRVRAMTSPRHVPGRIIAVSDLPRTRNGKLAELSVRDIVHGREVTNREALANPESLDEFRDLPQLQG
jgi:acetoacetyl-CoA synthetase